jgi:hypothetical protein
MDPYPDQIKIRIRICINLQMASQNVWNISLFEHFFTNLNLYSDSDSDPDPHQSEKSDLDQIKIKIRIRIKVMHTGSWRLELYAIRILN